MAYENLKMLVAGMSGEIYLTKVLKSGLMGETRRIATSDCLRATTEWFMKNEKKMIAYEHNSKGKKPYLFYTDNPEKAERILNILKEEQCIVRPNNATYRKNRVVEKNSTTFERRKDGNFIR